jgi:hypothetical protein
MPPKKSAAKAPSSKRTMSPQHKAAIAEGRVQSRAVKKYLEALSANKPTRGRPRNAGSIKERIGAIDAGIGEADPITALKLRQEKKNLQAELDKKDSKVDLSSVEDDFVANAKAYGARNGISYRVWRDSGVSTEILNKAGISRGS